MTDTKASKAIYLVSPLLISLFLIMIGNGLQGTLLGLRAGVIGFSIDITGLVMAMYYLGFLVGCRTVPGFVCAVGHIRVFAAMASLASCAILIHQTTNSAIVWGLARAVTGLSFAGLFIVTESWLNNIATAKLRSKIFSAYIFTINAGLFAGQFLLYLDDISSPLLFIIGSIIISLALMPVTLIESLSPTYVPPEPLPWKKLFQYSPLAIAGVIASGIGAGTIFSLLPPFMAQQGATPQSAAGFIATYVLGAALLPLLISTYGDHFERRKTIITVASFCTLIASTLILYPQSYFLIFLFGGGVASTYITSIACMHDHIPANSIISATASLILLNTIGAFSGPVIVGLISSYIGPNSLFITIVVTFFMLIVIGIIRDYMAESLSTDKQSDLTMFPAQSAPSTLRILRGKKKKKA